MSDNSKLMSTEIGGEGGQYEGDLGLVDQAKKSSGQLGAVDTTIDQSRTTEDLQRQKERGEQTAANIRYGQAISEEGMGGMTQGMTGQSSDDGYGKVNQGVESANSETTKQAQGYGKGSGVDEEVGA
ncbi:Hypothetical protein R9X50_00629000 [Acrodontium crateriforme]|uniref:Uncharacterized protein n=1 Tax=Acrodontium crateriforme TaxID=150365 RepID=A0AAQ3M9F6_9PEZI|nr:Hypothetical protein R9X50_00629000 [Acrodontium crateriforme]